LNSIAGIGLLKQALNRWQQNQGNSDEKFWQAELTSYSFVLSQAFSSPVSLIQKEAYLGGMSVCDPCAGSDGMLIQSRYCVEEIGGNPRDLSLDDHRR
jgi:hypothetical protein